MGDMHSLRVEMKLLLSLSSIERSLESKEGNNDQQMTPEVLNEAFQRKLNDKNLENTMKNPTLPCFQHINKVCSS